MKILLFGKNGQVGWELQRSLAPLGELVALSSDSQILCGNLTNLVGIQKTIQELSPDIIVNAAAYTAVDKAEKEPELAHLINAQAPGLLAQEAKRLNAWLVHYSTDYVFDGSGHHPRLETEATNPLNVYGESKLAGEKNIIASGCSHLIFRTSWVYGAHGNNFIKTILRLAQERDHLDIVDDQIGAPTGAELLADITAQIIHTTSHNSLNKSGTYHLTADGHTSWYNFADLILTYARQFELPLKIQPDAVRAIKTANFPTPAKRPLNSRLNTCKLQNTFGLSLPNWQTGVTRTLNEILGKQ
jgi:dTDP-4-dehydrorhamnose reductase